MDPSSGDGARPDWTAGVTESLRMKNRTIIEQDIRDSPDANVPNLAAICAADLFEEGFFKEATNEYDYLTMISDFIEMVRHHPGFLKACGKPPQLKRTVPSSKQQKGKEPMGAAEDLLQWHYEVTAFLMKLAMLYSQQLDLSCKTLNYSSTQQTIMHRTVMLHREWACADLWSALMKLKAEIKSKEYLDGRESSQMINSPEWYEKKIYWILKSFSNLINDNLDEQQPDELHQYLRVLESRVLNLQLSLQQ